jgi:hypothetical protein
MTRCSQIPQARSLVHFLSKLAPRLRSKLPFQLSAANTSSWDGKFVSGRHIGAAIDYAVPEDTPDSHYFLNNTRVDDDGTVVGELWYNIADNIPFTGLLAIDTESNIAPLEWTPGGTNFFSFDKNGELQVSYNSHWYGCTQPSNYGDMQVVSWKLGKGDPDIAGCAKLTVTKA